MSANGRRSERDRRLQELSDRKTAVAKERERLAEEIDDVDIDPQTDIVEKYVDGEVQVELTDSAKRRRVAANISKSAPVDRVDPSEVRLTDSGYELAPEAERRLDRARVEQLRSELPNSNAIFVPPEGEGFEARNLVSSISYAVRTPDDLNDAGAVASAAGVGLNDLRDPVSVIQKLDPEEAAGPLPFVDDPETIRKAQKQIAERKQEFQEDPALLGAEIFESDDSLRDFTTFANMGERSFDTRLARIRGAYRIANEREDEITERIASNNELLKPNDIEVTVDQRNFRPDVNIDRDAVEERQRDRLRTKAAEEAGVEESLIDISQSDDRLQASIDRDAQKQQFRRETASEYGVDVSDVSVELTDDQLRAEIRRDRGRRQQQADEQRQIELPGDEEEPIETNDFGKVSVSTAPDDPLFASQEQTKLEQQINMVQPALDDASEAIGPRLRGFGASAGSAIGTLSPLPAVEEAVFGTNRLDAAYEGFGEEAASALNVPAAASGTLDAAEFVAEGPDTGSRTEVAAETATAAVDKFTEAATERPVETTGRTIGALAGGFGAGAVASRGARGISSARRLVDMDFDEFAGATRAQADLDITGRSADETIEVADSDRFSPIPDDAAEQRALSRDNPRLSASEAGSRRVVDEQIEAGRRQEAPDPSDRPSPSRPRRETFSAAPDADEIRTVSREPRTGPSSNNQVRERFQWESLKAAQMDTPDADFRTVDRAGRVPEDDLRAVAEMDRSVPREVEIDRGGVVGASGALVSSADVGEVTGSPTLTGEQTPETEQTLLETSRSDSRSDATVDSESRTRTRTEAAADTDLRGMSLGLLGLNNQSATDSALGVDTSARGAVGSRSQSETVSDLLTDIGVDVGPASRVATGGSAAGATGATARTGTTTTANRPTPATRGPLTRLLPTRPTRPQPRAPDLPETEQSDDRREESFDFFGASADRRSAGAGPAAGWFGETLDAFATGAFGNRRLPAQGGAAPGGVGLELPTATIADPSEEQQDDVAAVFDFFGLGAGTPQSDQEADDDGEWLI